MKHLKSFRSLTESLLPLTSEKLPPSNDHYQDGQKVRYKGLVYTIDSPLYEEETQEWTYNLIGQSETIYGVYDHQLVPHLNIHL